MPKGAWHAETGVLRAGRCGYALETDGGGTWRLDAPRMARRYLGMRVTVEGRRSGFDLLDVHRIVPAGRLPRRRLLRWPTLFAFFRPG